MKANRHIVSHVTKNWKISYQSDDRSHQKKIPFEKLFPDGETPSTFTPPERFEPVIPSQSQAGPVNPRWKLPPSEWPRIVESVDQGELLREIAASYRVTYPVARKAEKLARLGLNLPPRPRPSQWKIPEAEWLAVLQQIEQGVSLSQIGKAYGVSRKAVKRVEQAARQRLQVEAHSSTPSYPGNILPNAWPELLERIDRGEAFAELASVYAVSPITLRRVEKVARQALGMPERPRYRHWQIQPSQWPAIVARLDQGVSQRQLAREYGVSPSTIKAVKRAARLQP